jgi:hypothetical protein
VGRVKALLGKISMNKKRYKGLMIEEAGEKLE